ncbi:MAG: Smr/MutS family protein, partial [Nannocystaceae bacterium]
APLPVLNIRQLPRDRALEQVATFLAQQRQAGKKFVRVITGKGLSSRGDPVLKPAVIAYCEGPGATDVTAWAPERDRQGAFGSIVIRLRSRHQSPLGQ